MTPVLDVQGRDGARRAGRVLAQAFVDDPVFGWFLTGSDRERRLASVFRLFADSADRTPEGRVVMSGDDAAAVWSPPGHWRHGLLELLRTAPASVGALRGGTVRALRVQRALEQQHPREPHWYLQAVGSVPAAQGTGAGSRVLAPVLEQCDRTGVPAYLESSNPRNWPFYERQGFVRSADCRVPEGCPVIAPFWREPR